MNAAAVKRRKFRTTLADAIAHPLRSRCLTILADRVASPAEISRELGVEVAAVGYHVKSLSEANLIEEVGNRQVRGAVEHFYRAVVAPHISAEEEADLTASQRKTFAETTLSIFAANASHALADGSMIERTSHCLTRVPIRLDEQGWSELSEAYADLLERTFEIKEQSAERLGGEPNDPGISAISFLAFFEMPRDAQGAATEVPT